MRSCASLVSALYASNCGSGMNDVRSTMPSRSNVLNTPSVRTPLLRRCEMIAMRPLASWRVSTSTKPGVYGAPPLWAEAGAAGADGALGSGLDCLSDLEDFGG